MSWNKFITNNNGSFLQSYEWGEFQKILGRKIWRIDQNHLKAQIIKHNLSLNKSYLYIPKAPVLENQNSYNKQEELDKFFSQIIEIAKNEKVIFCKLEPEANYPFSDKSVNIQAPSQNIQPQKTLLLDLLLSEENILNQMHHKTRYNIRLADKKGVTFKEAQAGDTIVQEEFWNLLKKTAERDNFKTHSKSYYENMFQVLDSHDMAKFFLAEYDDKIIAVNLVIFFNNTATYLHGASDYQYRKLMAPYLLQWGAILEAKKRNMKYYDFWGIDEVKWPGITRFKKGFGGKEVIYPFAYDIIFRPFWYQLYQTAKKIF